MHSVLLTRPEHQIEPFKTELEALGFTVLAQPTITVEPLENFSEVDAAIESLRNEKFDWIVFASVNGVRFFVERLRYWQTDLPPEVRLAAVGSGTGKALREWTGRPADVLPEIFTAEGVVQKLRSEAGQNKRFLILRADRGRDVLRRQLEESGGIVTETAVYRSADIERPEPEIKKLLDRGQIDWTTVTSSAIADSLVRMFDESLRKTRLLSIGPITTETLQKRGFPPDAEASPSSMEGMIDFLKTFSPPLAF